MDIDGNTQLIGILADPISHVRTPQLFNALVAKQGLNVVCVPCHVSPARLPQWLAGAPALQNFLGLVVTIPHKEAVVAACHELSVSAQLVGAVNVMRWDRQRQHWVGANFDGDGFVAGARDQGYRFTGKRVLQIGAGGAGKSIAYAVAREQPAALVIHNRSEARGKALVERLSAALPTVSITTGSADASDFDVVINATSLGLKDGDPLPLPAESIAPGTLVCEAVMRDGDSALLSAARSRGALAHRGQYMLYGQMVEMARFLGVTLASTLIDRLPGD